MPSQLPTDMLLHNPLNYQVIHFSKKGLKVHGEAWANIVGTWLDNNLQKGE